MAVSKVCSVFRPGLFLGKSAIVTGGGTGIGCAIAQELLHLGCKVMIASRKLDKLEESASNMRKLLPEERTEHLQIMQCNIRKEEEVKNLISTTISQFGGLDYLVNNGGGQFLTSVESISAKGWNAVLETNLTGTFYMCREAYNQWMCNNGGAIVNIIADMWKGMPGMSHSGAARAGVYNLTMTMAVEWAKSGVRLNTVSPGSSIYSKSAMENYSKGGDFNVFAAQAARNPAQRLGTTEEISGTVCYLLSPAASFISGINMRVDGGQHMYSTSLPWPVDKHDNSHAYTWEKDIENELRKTGGTVPKVKANL